MKINIENKEIIYSVNYSNRKTMSIDITNEGHINIKAPSKSTTDEIEAFLLSNKRDILAMVERLENRIYIHRDKSYHEGETFLYMGKPLSLNELLEAIPETEEDIQKELKRFYTKSTKEIIKKRVKHYEKIIGVKAKSVTIVDSVGTWGTCNSLRELTFNYKLSMAPLNVIDYVVIHELCHIMHLNHDRSFWRKVGAFDPDFKAKQDYLSRFGTVMTI